MATKSYSFIIDLKNPSGIAPINIVQGDTDSNIFNISITVDNGPVDLTDSTIAIVMAKADGTSVVDVCNIVDALKGLITYTVASQGYAVLGTVLCSIEITKGLSRTTSQQFKFKVVASLSDEDLVQSQTDYPILTQLINDVQGGSVVYKPMVTTYADIATTYPNPKNGWTVQVTSTHTKYRWNGTAWIDIGAYQDDSIGDMGQITETNLVAAIKNDRTELTGYASQLTDITNKQGDISALTTTDKTSVIKAINEIKSQANANQVGLDAANVNISANETNINAQKGRIDNLVQTASASFYEKCLQTDTGALLVVSSGATTGQINLASVTPAATGYTPAANDYVRLVYGVASGTAELIDSRVGADGVTYASAGEAVRGQIGGLMVGKANKSAIVKTLENFAINMSGNYAVTTGYTSAFIEVKSGDNVQITPNANGTFYSVLSSIDNLTVGTAAQFATGYAAPIALGSTISFTAPSDAKYIWILTYYSSKDRTPSIFTINDYNILEDIYYNIGNNIANIKSVDARVTTLENVSTDTPYDAEIGDKFSTATYSGGVNSSGEEKRQKRRYRNRNIIAVNHDDLPPQDYLNTRKIYNKYGFNANFNFILKPFADANTRDLMIQNIKALVTDGNDLGLHAIMGSSYWWMNKMFDIRPNFSFTFAPELSDITTIVSGGKNIFGYIVDSTKKLSDVGFTSPLSTYASTPITSLTSNDFITIMANYCLYASQEHVTGLDLSGVSQTWKNLYWLEYWYNNLIDNTLGYSSTGDFSTAITEDYEIPNGGAASDYYPDAAHLLSGKIVFFDDTSNPNYNNTDYQKVGRFKKGLFKGSASCCNYEVEDRCIEVAKAFCKYYFGVSKFTNFGRHGVGFVNCLWMNGNTPYDNRDKTVITGEVSKVYKTRLGKFESQYDVLLREGIKMTNYCTPLEAIYESQVGLYYGQNGIRNPFFNHCTRYHGDISYLNLLDTANTYTGQPVNYNSFNNIMKDKQDWLKFAYENANKLVTSTDGQSSLYVTLYLKNAIDIIRACKETGKIPVLSLDTIVNDASTSAAIELLCQYCYENDIEIVPMEYARKMAVGNSREIKKNYFPNPSFNQSLINRFEESTIPEAYIPDGWTISNGRYYGTTPSFSVNVENGNRVLTIGSKGIGYAYIETRMYGLPAGTYNLKFKAKASDAGNGYVQVFAKHNSDTIESTSYVNGGSIQPTTEYVEYSVTVEIPEPYCKISDGTPESQYSQGYEDNISNIMVIAGLSTPSATDLEHEYTMSIYDIRMEQI